MAYFVALVHKAHPGYGVTFPDLPGCISGGDTVDDALANAAEAAAMHIAGLSDDGADVPVGRGVDDLRADPEFAEDFDGHELVSLVPVALPDKTVRINVTMESRLLAAIDRTAERLGSTRSGFLAEAARARLAEVRRAAEGPVPGNKRNRV